MCLNTTTYPSILIRSLTGWLQELCPEAPSVPGAQLGEDEGQTGAVEEGGRAGEREGEQPLAVCPLGRSHS